VQAMDEEETCLVWKGLTEERLAIFNLLKKPALSSQEIERIKAVVGDLLEILKSQEAARRSLAGQESHPRCRAAHLPSLPKATLVLLRAADGRVRDTSEGTYPHGNRPI